MEASNRTGTQIHGTRNEHHRNIGWTPLDLQNLFTGEMNNVVEFTVSFFLHAIDPINVTMAYRATSLLLKGQFRLRIISIN